jgi:hypothetical protein
MPKVLHVSFLWDDDQINQRHSDYILSMGWVKEGWDVLYFDYRGTAEEIGNEKMNESLYQIVMQHQPDLLWFTKSDGVSKRFGGKRISSHIDSGIIRKLRADGFKGKVIHWFLDQRYDYYKSTLNVGSESDWFFYAAAGDRLEEYSYRMKTPASFIIVPYEPSFLYPVEFGKRVYDLTWFGGAHKPTRNKFEDTRYELLKSMTSSGELRNYYGCFGKHKVWCPEYQKILGNSKMSLSLYAFDRPLYFSNRLSHTIGSGTAVLSYDFQDREKLFSDDEGIFFKTFDQFKEKKRYYNQNPEELELIASNGYRKAREYFESSSVVREILHTLRNGKSSYPFGHTCNKRGTKLDIPETDKEIGDIYYLNHYGNFISIEEFSSHYGSEEVKKRAEEERRRLRSERMNELKRSNMSRLTKRAADRIKGKKPRIY